MNRMYLLLFAIFVMMYTPMQIANGQIPLERRGSDVRALPHIPLDECIDINNLNQNRIIKDGICYEDNREIYLCSEGECRFWSNDDIRKKFLGPLLEELQESRERLTENENENQNNPFTDPCSPLNLVLCPTD